MVSTAALHPLIAKETNKNIEINAIIPRMVSEEVKDNLEHRDYVDTYVSKALVKVDDAIEVDTTNMSIDEVVNYILKLVEMKVKE